LQILSNNEIWFNGDYIAIYIDEDSLYHKLTVSSNEYIDFIQQTILSLENDISEIN
jgi:hypothetical protein